MIRVWCDDNLLHVMPVNKQSVNVMEVTHMGCNHDLAQVGLVQQSVEESGGVRQAAQNAAVCAVAITVVGIDWRSRLTCNTQNHIIRQQLSWRTLIHIRQAAQNAAVCTVAITIIGVHWRSRLTCDTQRPIDQAATGHMTQHSPVFEAGR